MRQVGNVEAGRTHKSGLSHQRQTEAFGAQFMIIRGTTAKFILFAAAFALSVSAAQAGDEKPWSLQLQAGTSYDDNVLIEQIDTTSGGGDVAANLALSAGYKLVDSKTDKLSIGYDFTQSLHGKLTAFDIQNHDLSISGSTQIDGTTLGASYSFYHLLLGGRSFLDLHLVNPSILIPVTPHIFVRGAYMYMYKSFLGSNSNRSASHHQPEGQVFYFFDDARAYLQAGGDYEIENANGPEFTYKGYALNTSLQLPLNVMSREGKLTASYTYLHRNYDNITPLIGAKRHETRSTFKVGAEVPLVEKLSFLLDYQHVDSNSNLPSAKYTENVISGALRYDF
ncbi:MAG: hypothetical protein KGI68_05390 [Alphaproteobacteria bacterium]|nr:hypothetical protein [Alphaproteobacteria bacterium]